MSKDIKPTVSFKNPYWISKHRHYELKHFCLQYPEWKRACSALDERSRVAVVKTAYERRSNSHVDPTAKFALAKSEYMRKIKMVEDVAIETDEELSDYILKAVTEGRPYSYMKTKMDIPCSRDTFYDRCRRFYWLLSQER